MKTFTTPATPPIEFEIDGDRFVAVGVAPANALMNMASGGDGAAALTAMREFFGTVLDDDSWTRMQARMSDSQRPIDFRTAMDVFSWLASEYAGRPTELPSGSPDGQAPTGASSTEPAPSAA